MTNRLHKIVFRVVLSHSGEDDLKVRYGLAATQLDYVPSYKMKFGKLSVQSVERVSDGFEVYLRTLEDPTEHSYPRNNYDSVGDMETVVREGLPEVYWQFTDLPQKADRS